MTDMKPERTATDVTRYVQHADGDTVRPTMRGYSLRCCDCGLVHTLDFEVVDDGAVPYVEFQAWRHPRATAQCRRKHLDKVAASLAPYVPPEHLQDAAKAVLQGM